MTLRLPAGYVEGKAAQAASGGARVVLGVPQESALWDDDAVGLVG
jgi:hypothetical protein